MQEQDKDIWTYEENGTRYEICYTPESIRHPAKMFIPMCREIIKRYTKPGDLVLDCMAGIGTTIIEGMLLSRNVIGVEYEQKFVDMAQANIDKTNKQMGFMKGLGIGKIVKGDSRELVKVLGGVWAENIIFSPPFADKVASQDKKWLKERVGMKGGQADEQEYSDNKEDNGNIANLKYNPLEKGGENITASGELPFSNVTMEKPASDKWQGPDFTQQVYSTDKEDKNQIANLKYADNGVDNAIVTSPPFANTLGTNQTGEGTSTYKQTGFANTVPYSQTKDNIGNMPYKADSIITSPPYGHESYKTKEQQAGHDSQCGEDKFGYAENYSDDLNNCGNYSGQTYLDAMLVIYQQCFAVLKNEGSMILVTKNFTRAGKEVRLDTDTIKLCEMAGFEYVTRHYRKIKNPSFWIQNAIIKWKKKYPDIPPPYPMFEDVLVFKKRKHEDAERERELIQ